MVKKEKVLQEDPQVEEIFTAEAEVLESSELYTTPQEAAEDVVKEGENDKPNFIKWDFGHLTMSCSRCGYNEILQEDVEDGLMFTIPTTDKHNLIMECPQCKTTIKLYWQKSDKVKSLEVKEDEAVQEESKEE